MEWALTGSAALALHGAGVRPRDLDIVTTAAGAREIAERFGAAASYEVRGAVRGVLADLMVDGVDVEVLGDVENRVPDGRWSPPLRLEGRVAQVGGLPVLSLEALEEGYRQMGRHDRAALARALLGGLS